MLPRVLQIIITFFNLGIVLGKVLIGHSISKPRSRIYAKHWMVSVLIDHQILPLCICILLLENVKQFIGLLTSSSKHSVEVMLLQGPY